MKIVIGGHSLGAADAALYACSRVSRNLPVDGLLMLGCPRPGNSIIGHLLDKSVPMILSVKNLMDGVTDVPFDAHVQEMGWDYADVWPFTPIDEAPLFEDFLKDPFFCHHHIALYQRGVKKLKSFPFGDMSLSDAVDAIADLYGPPDPTKWNWFNPVDGLYWAARIFGDTNFIIRRGSVTGKDWLTEDFDFNQIDEFGAKISQGFWAGVAPVLSELDAVASATA